MCVPFLSDRQASMITSNHPRKIRGMYKIRAIVIMPFLVKADQQNTILKKKYHTNNTHPRIFPICFKHYLITL